MYGHRIEIHYGVVSDNVDPEMLGRLKVTCGTLLPDDTEVAAWVEPCFPYLASSDQQKTDAGWCFIPDIGVVVELEVTVSSPSDDSPGFSAVNAPDIKWRACTIARGTDTIPSLFTTNYPNRRGWVTGRGHVLMMDDTKGDERIELSLAYSAGTTFIAMDKDGNLMLATGSSANLVQLDAKNGGIFMLDANSNLLNMSADGWYITSGDSDMVKAGGGEVSVMTGTMLFNCTNILAQTGEFVVGQLGLQTAVICEGLLGFQATLASAFTEIAGLIAGLGLVAATTTGTVVPALQAGSFSATLLFSE